MPTYIESYAIQYTPAKAPTTEAHQIAELWGKADKFEEKARYARLEVGYRLLELRQRVERGEAGGDVEWWIWIKGYIARTRRDMEKCMALARAEDPEAAVEAERTATREAVRKHRAKHDGLRKTQANVVEFRPPQPEPEPKTYEEAVEEQARMYAVQQEDYPMMSAHKAADALSPLKHAIFLRQRIDKLTKKERAEFAVWFNKQYGDEDA
jgi:hypothetical protein